MLGLTVEIHHQCQLYLFPKAKLKWLIRHTR